MRVNFLSMIFYCEFSIFDPELNAFKAEAKNSPTERVLRVLYWVLIKSLALFKTLITKGFLYNF